MKRYSIMFPFPVRPLLVTPFRSFCAALSLFAAMAGNSSAAVILRIDISNLSTTTITATGANAQNDDIDETYLNEGILLLGFFSSEPGPTIPDSFDFSELYSPGGRFEFTTLFLAAVSGANEVDLNIAGSGFSTNDFSTSEAAFTGSATVDFSRLAAYLVPGSRGDILAGDAFYNTVVIGQWEIIPEPGSFALALVPVFAGLLRRKRMSP